MGANSLSSLENFSDTSSLPPELALINSWQRDFPLVARPFAAIAEVVGAEEHEVLALFRAALAKGWIDRIGPVWAPRRIGWSTLAAAAVPPAQVAAVGEWLSSFPEVNHNYWRVGDALNLWFVLTVPSKAAGEAFLQRISKALGFPVYRFPLVREYYIDLGFDLTQGRSPTSAPSRLEAFRPLENLEITQAEQRLVAGLSRGIPLVAEPFAALAAQLGDRSAEAILAQLRAWLTAGVIRRFGAVVRHRALGWTTNGMAVWAVAQEEIDKVGEQLAADPAVHLCYRREPALPRWPYTLYAMIYARTAQSLTETVERLRSTYQMNDYPHRLLVSVHCFKQTGAQYYGQRSAA